MDSVALTLFQIRMHSATWEPCAEEGAEVLRKLKHVGLHRSGIRRAKCPARG